MNTLGSRALHGLELGARRQHSHAQRGCLPPKPQTMNAARAIVAQGAARVHVRIIVSHQAMVTAASKGIQEQKI